MIGLADRCDRIAGHPGFFVAFNIALVAMFQAAGVDVANIFISIVTADLVLIGLGAARRDRSALHAKLDELLAAIPDARDELVHAEQLCEQAIEEIRR